MDLLVRKFCELSVTITEIQSGACDAMNTNEERVQMPRLPIKNETEFTIWEKHLVITKNYDKFVRLTGICNCNWITFRFKI